MDTANYNKRTEPHVFSALDLRDVRLLHMRHFIRIPGLTIENWLRAARARGPV